jgi:chromosome segregation ATPase
MNPLTLPVGIAARVLGDLAAIAAAARAAVPVAESVGELDLKQMQTDLHTLAQAAARLPEVEAELTRRMDEMENTAETGVAQLERATAAAEAIVASLPVIEAGIDEVRRATAAAEALAAAAPDIAAGVPEIAKARAAAEKLVDGLDEVRASRETLLEMKGQAEQLIGASERAQTALDRASDNVELALARAEPLQGLTERIARLNERLPGGRSQGGGA